jgi:hypothetical protein
MNGNPMNRVRWRIQAFIIRANATEMQSEFCSNAHASARNTRINVKHGQMGNVGESSRSCFVFQPAPTPIAIRTIALTLS